MITQTSPCQELSFRVQLHNTRFVWQVRKQVDWYRFRQICLRQWAEIKVGLPMGKYSFTICTKKPGFFGWNVKWNGSTRWRFSGIEGMLRRYSSFFISTEMTGISYTICKNLTRAILSPTLALVAPVYRAQLSRFWPVFTGRNKLFYLSQKSHPKIPCKW